MAEMLLEWVFTSIFLILVVLALRAVLGKRMGAGLCYALWAVVLVRLLVPVQLFTSPLAGTTFVLSGTRGEHDVYTPVNPAATQAGTDGALSLDGQDGPAAGWMAVPRVPDAPTLPAAPEPPAAPDLTKAPAWLGWVWLAGSAAAAFVLLTSNLRFYWRLRRERIPLDGVDRPLRVYVAAGLPSPCLFGIVRPAVYVTPEAAADPDMLRHVLAHEYTHYRHGDHLWSLLRCAALAAHWWNPLVWLAVRLSRRDGELACDEGALKRLGDGERAAYGGTLLALVTAKPRPADLFRCATTMAGDKKSLKERIGRIACAPRRVVWAAIVVVLVTVLACVCAFGQAAPEEAEPNLWPYNVSEVTYIRDKGGFGGDFSIRLNQDGSFTYYAGLLSSYIGMGTWTRDGDVICLADVGLNDSVGIQRYYFKMDGGDLVFLAEDSAEFMYVDVADGDRFSRKAAGTDGETAVEVAFRHTGSDPASSFYVPASVLDTAKAMAAERFQAEAPGGWVTTFGSSYDGEKGEWVPVPLDNPVYFDRVRIENMEGPWTETRQGVEIEVWRMNYEFHTTMPQEAEALLAGGRYLTEDGWLCPTYPNCTYLFFEREGEEMRFLTAGIQNDCGPDDEGDAKERFYAPADEALERERLADEWGVHRVLMFTYPDLNRDGVPETIATGVIGDGMGTRVGVWQGADVGSYDEEWWDNAELLWADEGYKAHAGYNAVFLCTLDGEDYLLRYHPTMYQGWCTYEYQLFTLTESGEERVVRENSVEFDINFQPWLHEKFDPEAIAAFMDEVNGLLADSFQLINTDADLFDTFAESGRMYDDLWWLDGWEPVFTRDPSKSLLENLRAFQQAMEDQQFADAPEASMT